MATTSPTSVASRSTRSSSKRSVTSFLNASSSEEKTKKARKKVDIDDNHNDDNETEATGVEVKVKQASTKKGKTTKKSTKAATTAATNKSSMTFGYDDNPNGSDRVGMTDDERAQQEKLITPFMRRVYAWTKRIPKGQVSTYGDIAKAMGDPGCSRAVGSALKRNPFAPEVPCHRVLKSDLDIGGFFGATSSTSARVQRKIELLQGEGVPFVGTKVPAAKREKVVVQFDDTPITAAETLSTSLRKPIAL